MLSWLIPERQQRLRPMHIPLHLMHRWQRHFLHRLRNRLRPELQHLRRNQHLVIQLQHSSAKLRQRL